MPRHTDSRGERRSITVAPGADLPRWLREEVVRSTPKERREAALLELRRGLEAYASDRHRQAAAAFRKAKELAPRSATIRELLGLSCYQTENWSEALRELRAFRRIAGDTTHMAVEMDCLRALGKSMDVAKTWERFLELGGTREGEDEARVVYASHLLDQGRVADAWNVIKPGRLVADAPESALRRWAVAARIAHTAGDAQSCRTLMDAIRKQAPDAPWLDDLSHEVGT